MKAAVRYTYGDERNVKIEQVLLPLIKEDQVLVKVHYTTVNRTDCGVTFGWPLVMRLFTGVFKPEHPVVGTDFAGVVTQVGKKVTDFKINDRVFGFRDEGLQSQAEFLAINSDANILKIPEGISFENAAASLEGAHYAINFLNKVKLQKGQHILLNGATGAIGSAMLQFLKIQGMKVTAVCNTKNIDRIKALGADHIIDYLKEDYTQCGKMFDHVIDAVGKNTFGNSIKVLKNGGTYTSSELGPYWQNIFLAFWTPIFSKRKVIFPLPSNIKESIRVISERLSNSSFQPLIDCVYPLDKVKEAYGYVASGEKTGNVLLKVIQD